MWGPSEKFDQTEATNPGPVELYEALGGSREVIVRRS